MTVSGSERELSRTLARAIDDAFVATRAMDPAEVVSTFDRIEAIHLPMLGGNPVLELETKRRVAEQKFLSLSRRRLSFDFVQSLFEGVRKLGYTNLDKEVTMEIIFARVCIRHNRIDQAAEVLKQVRGKLDRALQGDAPEVYRGAMRTTQNLLRQITE